MDTKDTNLPHINADMNVENIYVVYEFTSPIENWKFDPGIHHYNALSFFIDGEALFYIDDKTVKINKNKIIFIPAGVPFHSRGIKGPFHYISIQFTLSDNRLIYPFQKYYDLSNPQYFQNMFINMRDEWTIKSFGYKLRIKSILYNIVNRLVVEDIKYIKYFKNYHLIKDSIKYMEENYFNSSLNIEDIAAVSNITSSHFRNLFKEIYNISPIKHINRFRISKAMEMLEFSKISINKIGETVGYTNAYYFNRIFKQISGLTPSQYRKNTKN